MRSRPRPDSDSSISSRTAGSVVVWTLLLGLLSTGGMSLARAQERRVASPAGRSAVQVGGHYDRDGRYFGGQWIEVRYGRPILRGRDVFGPPDFVLRLNDGAPVWRAGANVSTQLITEVPLVIGKTTIDPGEYTLFIRLTRKRWTLIVSSWPAQQKYQQNNRDALFGAFHYRPNKDVVRAEMTLDALPHSFEQLSWQFLDVDPHGGKLALLWDDQIAWVRFTVRESSLPE